MSSVRSKLPTLAIVLGMLMVVHAVGAWILSGRPVWTRTPDPSLATMAREEGSLTRAFADQPSTLAPVQSGFALGLLPSGLGWASLSLVTLAGPGVGLVFWGLRVRRHLAHTQSPA